MAAMASIYKIFNLHAYLLQNGLSDRADIYSEALGRQENSEFYFFGQTWTFKVGPT